MVAPGIFIPLTEEDGLIVAMGEWILRTACSEAASWPNPLQISVNLSPVQFRNDDIVRLVHETLIETGLDAAQLELEITEGVLIDDFSRAVSILRRLKSLGVRMRSTISAPATRRCPTAGVSVRHDQVTAASYRPQPLAIEGPVRGVIGLAPGSSSSDRRRRRAEPSSMSSPVPAAISCRAS